MRPVTWQGKRDVRVDTVPDPKIEDPTDVVVRITSTHRLPLEAAPEAYRTFQHKADGRVKTLLQPGAVA